MKSIEKNIYRVNGAFLMKVAIKTSQTITKHQLFRLLQNPGLVFVDQFSIPTVTNLKALAWKMALWMTKMR